MNEMFLFQLNMNKENLLNKIIKKFKYYDGIHVHTQFAWKKEENGIVATTKLYIYFIIRVMRIYHRLLCGIVILSHVLRCCVCGCGKLNNVTFQTDNQIKWFKRFDIRVEQKDYYVEKPKLKWMTATNKLTIWNIIMLFFVCEYSSSPLVDRLTVSHRTTFLIISWTINVIIVAPIESEPIVSHSACVCRRQISVMVTV